MSARLVACLLAALLAAPAARAEMKTFGVGYGSGLIGGTALGSRDGYHLATLASFGGHDVWEKDGMELSRAPKGTYAVSDSLFSQEPADLTSDAKLLLHLSTSRDANGNKVVSAALNGKPVGAAYSEIKLLRLSPRGENIAYAARDAAGWTVHSAQGAGPALPSAPAFLFVSDRETVYVTNWQGRMWMYRNGVPTSVPNYSLMSASDDLTRIGGVYSDPGTGAQWVDVNGAKSGPWDKAAAPVYSDDGRHYAFLARKGDSSGRNDLGETFDTVVVDGTAQKTIDGIANLLVDNAGVPYWTFASAGNSTAYRAGAKLGTTRGEFTPRWAGSSPSGAHYAAWVGGKLVVDGRVAEADAPKLHTACRIAFDGENEFHYIADDRSGLNLVCVTVDGSSAAASRCARIGKVLDHGLKALPAAQFAAPARAVTR
ncbi:MAG: hypothetical protein ACHQ49_01065 [Elusimicrobiota bacterium]